MHFRRGERWIAVRNVTGMLIGKACVAVLTAHTERLHWKKAVKTRMSIHAKRTRKGSFGHERDDY